MFSLEHGGLMAEIDEVFVADEIRSAGLGSLLVTRAERDLAERGMVRLQLQLGVHNGRARSFYERYGFQRRAGYELLDKAL
jgi:ribosomal protein S18 acetylase RimI-like enzyme